jgi:hypothetical protein
MFPSLSAQSDSLTLALSQRERVGVRVFTVKGEAQRCMNILPKRGSLRDEIFSRQDAKALSNPATSQLGVLCGFARA